MLKNNLSKEDILGFLRKNKNFFKEKFDVDKVMLFGSYARDTAKPDSDIDLLIESKNKSFDNIFDMKEFLEKEFKKKVDLIYRDSVRRFIMRLIEKELIYA